MASSISSSSSSNASLMSRFFRRRSNFHDPSGLENTRSQPNVSTDVDMFDIIDEIRPRATQRPDATARGMLSASDMRRLDLMENYYGIDLVSTRSEEIHTRVRNAASEAERRPRVDVHAIMKKCRKVVYKDRGHLWPGKVSKLESEQSECPVCLEQLLPKEKLLLLPCKHRFHIDCLTPWIKGNHGCCPVCRAEILGSSKKKTDRRNALTSYQSTLISAIAFRPRRLNRRNSDIGPRQHNNDEWEGLHQYIMASLAEVDNELIRLVH